LFSSSSSFGEKRREKRGEEKKRKKINTLEREQKNKPLKRLMNFKSVAH